MRAPPRFQPLRRALTAGIIGCCAVLLPFKVKAADRARLSSGGRADFLTGDWYGLRARLSDQGIEFSGSYTLATYRNTTGGVSRGSTVEGAADLNFDFDPTKLLHWPDVEFHAGLAIGHGPSVSSERVGDVGSLSSYYIASGVYLQEFWIQKKLLDRRIALRVGRLAADLEYPLYSFADSIELPIYPRGALGAQFRYEPNSTWFISTAFYAGRSGSSEGAIIAPVAAGLRSTAADAPTVIAMIGLNHGYDPNPQATAGTWKFGVYHSRGDFADVATYQPLRGNQGFFVNGDQGLWREHPTISGDSQGLSLIVIAEYAPPDRNRYHYGFGGGPYYTGLVRGRDADVLSLNMFSSFFSKTYARHSVSSDGPPFRAEHRLQLSYQAFITKYFSIIAEINYVIQPGGTITALPAAVIGLRASFSL